MNDVIPFTHETFGTVRSMRVDGEPWFVTADVCKALELKDTWMAIKGLDDDEKGVTIIYTLGGDQKVSIINEPVFIL